MGAKAAMGSTIPDLRPLNRFSTAFLLQHSQALSAKDVAVASGLVIPVTGPLSLAAMSGAQG